MSRTPRDAASAPPVTVTACADGPLIVRGEIDLVDEHGEPIDAHRRTVALCRCGASAIRPFCDGTHKSIGFRTEPPARTAAVTLADPLTPAEAAALVDADASAAGAD
ncbi:MULTISPECIES: CDGSH iron-sulfur domain-containing protein [unclassified Agromyces]|uniref:CDGSH iron-sulfur domain-containing protein n=1 Tax=unclassified Agromyces TaxID=2639701 RepID=UPI003014D852